MILGATIQTKFTEIVNIAKITEKIAKITESQNRQNF